MALRFAAVLSRHGAYARALQEAALKNTEKRLGRAINTEVVEHNDEPLETAFEVLPPKHQQEITNYLTHQLQFKQLLDKYASKGDDSMDMVQQSARYVGLDATMAPKDDPNDKNKK